MQGTSQMKKKMMMKIGEGKEKKKRRKENSDQKTQHLPITLILHRLLEGEDAAG